MPTSAAEDHDSDRPSICHEDFTNRHVSPSEDRLWHTETTALSQAERQCDNLSPTSQQNATLADALRETPMTYSVVPLSPMKPALKRSSDAFTVDAPGPAKRGRIASLKLGLSGVGSSSSSATITATGAVTRARSRVLRPSRVKNAAEPSRSVLAGSESVPSTEKSARGTINEAVNKPVPVSDSALWPPTTSSGETSKHTSEARHVIDLDETTCGSDSAKPEDTCNAIPTGRSGYFGSENDHERATRSTSALDDRRSHMNKAAGAHAPARLVRRVSFVRAYSLGSKRTLREAYLISGVITDSPDHSLYVHSIIIASHPITSRP